MNIIESLQDNQNIRVTYGNKWIVYDDSQWLCMGRVNGKCIELVRSDFQDEVMKELTKNG